MKPTNLTNINFDEIRESIKSYMRTREEFSDYDFTGSTLSYLIDVLAYNTYYSAFNANMALNEVFLDSASIRDNVISLAKVLNYTPRSTTAAKACISLSVQTQIGVNGQYPLSATLQKGPVCSGASPDTNFTFNVLEPVEALVDAATGIATFPEITVYEGDLLNYSYIVDTTVQQRFIIPNDRVDTSTVKVSTRPNVQSTLSDTYNLVKNITSIESDTRAYFLQETEDRRYEITFGDGIIGRELVQGEVIDIEYIRAVGPEANNISELKYVGTVIDINDQVITQAALTVKEKSQFGGTQESVKSIKFNAPKYYAAQNRAVTAQDYANITKTIYPNARYVSAYGGESLNPPVYGKVYVSIRTQTGAKLNNLSKQEIIRNLRPYSMASVDVVITDPNEIFVGTNILIVATTLASSYGDGTITQTTSDRLKNKSMEALKEYGAEEDLNNFNKTFSLQKLANNILRSDDDIEDVLASVSLYKRQEYPEQSGPKTFVFDYGTPLDCSCNTSPGKTILSSVFYTTDRPAVPQYFEDDGSGFLRSFTTINNKKTILDTNIGTYDCETGQVVFGPVELEGSISLPATLTTVDPSGSLTSTINDFFEENSTVGGKLVRSEDLTTAEQDGTTTGTTTDDGGETGGGGGGGAGGTGGTGDTTREELPGSLIKSAGLDGTYIFIADSAAGSNTSFTTGNGYSFLSDEGWSLGPGFVTFSEGGSGVFSFTGSATGAIGGVTGIGATGASTVSSAITLGGSVPTTITVSIKPGTTSISPGTLLSGAVLSFFTPTITVSSITQGGTINFPTGGVIGSPSLYTTPTLNVIGFTPLYTVSTGGSGGNCFS